MDSCPVAQRQLPVHEDVLSVVAQCYTDPAKIATYRSSEMFPPSFGVKLTEVWSFIGTGSMVCGWLTEHFRRVV